MTGNGKKIYIFILLKIMTTELHGGFCLSINLKSEHPFKNSVFSGLEVAYTF